MAQSRKQHHVRREMREWGESLKAECLETRYDELMLNKSNDERHVYVAPSFTIILIATSLIVYLPPNFAHCKAFKNETGLC